MFAELFDPVIKDRHNGYDPRTMKHPTDLDASKVILSSVLWITSSWASMSPCINSYMPNITLSFVVLRSPQDFLMSATCCHLVFVPVAASVDWASPLHARAPSAVKWSVWLWPLWLAWRETFLVDTTAWEIWLKESSNSLLMLVKIYTFLEARFIFLFVLISFAI